MTIPSTVDWREILPETMQLKHKALALDDYKDFIKWIDTDGMRLPAHLERTQARGAKTDYTTYDGEDDWQGEDEDDEVADDGLDLSKLITKLEDIFNEYGEVFAMSNSIAPQDAGWSIANGEVLQCQTPIEVISILKSSSLTTTDWDNRRSLNLPCHMIIRKWYNLERSLIFRAYVCDRKLVAVSQKILSEFHPYLIDVKLEIANASETLYNCIDERLRERLPEDYSFDFFLTKPGSKTQKRTAKLMGFHDTTEKLLFDEDGLPTTTTSETLPEVRVIEQTDDVVDCGPAAFLKAGLPIELQDMTQLVAAAEAVDNSRGGTIQGDVSEVIRLMQQQTDDK